MTIQKQVAVGHRESRYLSRKVWEGVVLTFILLFFGIARWSPWNAHDERRLILLFMLVAATVVQFWTAAPLYREILGALKKGTISADIPILLTLTATYLFSVEAILFPNFVRIETLDGEVFLTYNAVVVTVLLISKLLEWEAYSHSSNALKHLMRLQPKVAHVITDEGEINIPVEEVKRGDLVQVIPGERIPLDGTIHEGRSTIDESMITGESIPVEKRAGDEVIGGTVNRAGALLFKVSRTHQETIFSRIVNLVHEAQAGKIPLPRFEDRVTWIWLPFAVIASLAVLAGWLKLPGFGSVPLGVYHFIACLAMACPATFSLAASVSIVRAMEGGAEQGVILKKGEVVETARKLDAIIFDKTGTLTRGSPSLTDIIPLDGYREEDLLRIAASAERDSLHPLAKGIVRLAREKKIPLAVPHSFEDIPGRGVRASIDGKQVLLGNIKFMVEEDVPLARQEIATSLAEMGKTPMYMAIDRRLCAVFAFMDTLKLSSLEAVRDLTGLGLEVIMLTGDNRKTAEAIAREAGIKRVMAEVLPEEKIKVVRKIQNENKKVAMVGDGINDAPALAQAHISIAMGTGTDVAMEASDITLMRGDLKGVLSALYLSKHTMKVMLQSFLIAVLIQIIGIGAASGVSVPAVGFSLAPLTTTFFTALAFLAIVLNATRIKRAEQ